MKIMIVLLIKQRKKEKTTENPQKSTKGITRTNKVKKIEFSNSNILFSTNNPSYVTRKLYFEQTNPSYVTRRY